MDSARTSVSSDLAPEATEIEPSDIYVDAEGDWYNQGSKIFREEIVGLFLRNLHILPDGAFFIELRQKRCSLKAEDTPFVIAGVDRVEIGGSKEEILLRLRHLPAAEPLDPTTLYVGKDNVLYCRIHGGEMPARFSRPAYYQFAEWIKEDSLTGEFYVELGGRRYSIQVELS